MVSSLVLLVLMSMPPSKVVQEEGTDTSNHVSQKVSAAVIDHAYRISSAFPRLHLSTNIYNSRLGDDPKDLKDRLFDRLQDSMSAEEALAVEKDILDLWLDTGSDAVNLILQSAIDAQSDDQLELARELYDRTIKLVPECAECYNRRATLFFSQKHVDLALEDLNRAIKIDPRHFSAIVALGLILEDLGQKEAAYEAYRRAVLLHPHLKAAKNRLENLREEVSGRAL